MASDRRRGRTAHPEHAAAGERQRRSSDFRDDAHVRLTRKNTKEHKDFVILHVLVVKETQPTRFTAGGFQVPAPSGKIDGAVVFGQ
jgi:hypothetical protein